MAKCSRSVLVAVYTQLGTTQTVVTFSREDVAIELARRFIGERVTGGFDRIKSGEAPPCEFDSPHTPLETYMQS